MAGHLAFVVCASCGGTYAPVQADNTRYFHACPSTEDPKTGAIVPHVNARDENVPPAAVLEQRIEDTIAKNDQSFNTKANALRAAAVLAPGAGTAPVAAAVPDKGVV